VKKVGAAYGPGVVPMPGRTSFYNQTFWPLAGVRVGHHPALERQPAAGDVNPHRGHPPGELVQIDSTPIDVMVLLDSGAAVR
jgi:putative transposase